jgi:histidyl-tRNA synthetase
MVEQLLKVKNVTKINEFIKVFQDNVETDLSSKNIHWYAQAAFRGPEHRQCELRHHAQIRMSPAGAAATTATSLT